jgi:hypothetical protein
VQCGEDDQVARPLFEHQIEIPDFEMATHADQQRALADAASRPHPGGDPNPPLAVHLRGRDKPQPSSQQRLTRLALPPAEQGFLGIVMMHRDAVTVADDHARVIRVKTDEQIVADRARLYRHAEMIG